MDSHSEQIQGSIDLHAYVSIVKRRWLPATSIALAVCGLVVVSTALQDPIYEAKGKLLFNKQDRVSSLTDLTDQSREISGVAQDTNPLDTEAEIMRSDPIIEKAIAKLSLKHVENRSLTIDQFLQQLKVTSIGGTDLLEVSYRGKSPQEAAVAVNVLMQSYLENNILVNRAEAVAARKFINKQLPNVEARVSEAEAALQQFKELNQVVDLEEEAKAAVSDLSKLSEQATQAQAALLDATSRSQSIQSQIGLTPSQAVTLTTVSQSVAIQQVLKEYRQVQDQLAVQRSRYREGHPEIDNLVRKEAALGKQLQIRISQTLGVNQSTSDQDLQLSTLKQSLAEDLVKAEAERLGLASQVSTFSAAISNYQARMSTLPKLEKQQRELERRLEVARTTYEQLLKRLQEVEIVENQNVGNARIVAEAVEPVRPILPRRSRSLAIGVMLGLVSGVLIAFVLDAIDKSVKTPEEAEKLTGYPILGIIPLVSGSHYEKAHTAEFPVPARDDPYSSISTNFEMLQTTLGFTLSDQPLQVILIASAVSGEGKSFIAANLAAATAQMGRRVLLIDADMRQPSQHTIWHQINIKGLSDLLVEQVTISEAINQVQPNIWLLNSGTIPPNPIALLDSQHFASFIETMRQNYDFIILDTPALNLVADSLTIGKFVDGLLFVVRPKTSDFADVTQAKTLLRQAGHRVLGMVVNGCVPGKTTGKSYYTSRNMKQQTISKVSSNF